MQLRSSLVKEKRRDWIIRKRPTIQSLTRAQNLLDRRSACVTDPVVREIIKWGKCGINSWSEEFQLRTVCVTTEQTKKPATGELFDNSQKGTFPADICGPLQIPTFTGRRYVLTLTVVPQRFVSVHVMKSHLEIDEPCFNIVQWINGNCRNRLEWLHSDIAVEFLAIRKRLLRMRVESTTSSPYTPQTDGITEHKNRMPLNIKKAMLKDAGMKPRFWGEAIIQAANVYDCTSTPA